jgi:hypothetical protein
VAAALILIIWPWGTIDGAYLSPDPQISKHEFLLFKNGDVYGIVDTPPPIAPSIVHLGSYTFESGSGWVWQLRGTNRRITCKPYLLFMRFSWDEGNSMAATEPFRWRDPYFWKIRRIMKNEEVRAVLASETGRPTPATTVPSE